MSFARKIEKLAAQSISKMPTGVARLFGPTKVDGQTLDPHLKLLLGVNKKKGGFETLGTVENARKAYQHLVDSLERPEPPIASTRDRVVDSEGGPVPIRIYAPKGTGPHPCVIYFHGGGYTIGDLNTHDGLCRRFCRDLEATVVAVDYRLAPEHPFPAGVDDAVAVTRWVMESASELGIDAERVALAGDSAGGNFAAVVSQEVPGIKFQLLIYPGTDARSKLPSKTIFAEHFGLDKSTIDWFFDHYSQGADRGEPRLSPAASEKLSESPPTHLAVAGFDVLRDEGLSFGKLLQEAGVSCTIETHASLCHGFIHMTRVPGCDEGVEKLTQALRKGLQV
jgi:acetyl esterase